MATQWWGTRHNVSPRLIWEVEAMHATFGDTFQLREDANGGLYWIGTVEVNLVDLPMVEHTLKIVYPRNYPASPAEAYCVDPVIYSEKHQYEDGQLCLFNPTEGKQYGWNPSKSTAVTVTGWAIQWLYAYYTWRATGHWPGIEEYVTRRNTFSRRYGRRLGE